MFLRTFLDGNQLHGLIKCRLERLLIRAVRRLPPVGFQPRSFAAAHHVTRFGRTFTNIRNIDMELVPVGAATLFRARGAETCLGPT